MSKIHQAIRKAEKEGRSIISRSIEGAKRPQTIEDLVREVTNRPSAGSSNQEVRQTNLRALPVFEPESDQVVDLQVPPQSGIVSLADPRSFASSQYRVLWKKLFHLRQGKQLKTILITSVSPSEGKTLTAINLGLTIAQEIDQRVLLVDSNLKRPSVHSVLGLSVQKGLLDVLRGETSVTDVILRTKISNFAVLPFGSNSEQLAEPLNGEKMKDVLASITELFDWVILDSPPLVPFDEVECLTSLVDGILVVVGVKQTRESVVSKIQASVGRGRKPEEDSWTASVVSRIQALKGRNVLGFVLNGIHSQAELEVDL